ncbi:MAG TPA: acyl-CoA dehydrogenase [Cycloclasticus sp.]|nr:acyl-CoA dehydrogenase [Cycloclasticus sp.]HIL92832.1 acyl-CoA dehydrogenase [Cycloclasticus sp.]
MLFSQDHEMLREATAKFVEREINPYVDEWEDAGIFPAHELFKKMGDAGFLGIGRDEKWGGLGLDYSYVVVFAEEIGRIKCSGISTAIGVQTDMCTPALANFGSDELKRKYLVPAITGESVGCIGVSEEGAGSDVASIKTNAKRVGDEYIINGGKMWITTSTQADWVCLLCNTSEENGPHKNKSLIIVPLDTKGVTRGKSLKKLGAHSSDTAPLYFDDVHVPVGNLIGEEGKGFIYQMKQFQEERLFVMSKYLSQVQDAVDITIDYTKQRKAFGKPLIANQEIYFKLAEMQTDIQSVRALIYHACEKYINGEDVDMLTSMAKFKVGALGQTIPSACLQYWGGQGFMWDNLISRIFRDTRLCSIGGGANEVMLEIISKRMGIHPTSLK